MNITVGGFYQGETYRAYAVKVLKEFDNVSIKAKCLCCGTEQKIRKLSAVCFECETIGEWK